MLRCLDCGKVFEPSQKDQTLVLGDEVHVFYKCECGWTQQVVYYNGHVVQSFKDEEGGETNG